MGGVMVEMLLANGSELVAAVIEAIVFCTLPLSRCFSFSEQSVAIMFLKL